MDKVIERTNRFRLLAPIPARNKDPRPSNIAANLKPYSDADF